MVPKLDVRLDVFELKLKSELVFDGDAGVTSPSGASTRSGIEGSGTYHINHWLSAELNTAFTRARFDLKGPPDDLGCSDASPLYPCTRALGIMGRYIPNSPTNVTDAEFSAQRESGWWAPQADFVVHPGVPRTLRGRFQYVF